MEGGEGGDFFLSHPPLSGGNIIFTSEMKKGERKELPLKYFLEGKGKRGKEGGRNPSSQRKETSQTS